MKRYRARGFYEFLQLYQISPETIKTMQRNLTTQFNLEQNYSHVSSTYGFITVRIILPDHLHACHLNCYIETVRRDITYGELRHEWARIYGYTGHWIIEKGVIFLDDSYDTRTLDEIGILNGDTMCTSDKDCKLFLINY